MWSTSVACRSRRVAHAEEHAAKLGLGLHPIIATAVYCGPRKGEPFGLPWIDMAIDSGRLDINPSYRGLPKSGKPRHVPMHPEVVRILRQWKQRCPSTAEGLVFPVQLEPGVYRMGAKEDVLGLAELLKAAGCHVPAEPGTRCGTPSPRTPSCRARRCTQCTCSSATRCPR